MYITSADYDKQIEQTLRNIGHARVMFGISDDDIIRNATITATDNIVYSQPENLALGVDVFKTYETLEPNRFVLDGKNLLARKHTPIYQGYCSDTISGHNDRTTNFEVNPKIIITFPFDTAIEGLTLTFDTTKSEFIKRLNIITYNELGVVEDKDFSVKISDYPMLIINNKFKPARRIEIELMETFPSYRRARVLSILFGITRVIEDDELVSCKYDSKCELGSTSLPICDFEFEVLDTTNSFDPDNPDNIHNYLESGQPVTFQYGYELSNGIIEWIPVCRTYTTGEASVNGNKSLSKLTFKSSSILEKFNVIYDETEFGEFSLYDLALNIANFVGLPNALDLDEYLKELKTNIPLPKMTARELLQLIANAGLCTMSINRAGQIVIKREEIFSSDTPFVMDFSKMINEPKSHKVPFIKDLITGYNTNLIEGEVTELLKTTISSERERLFTLEYENSLNHNISTEGNIRIIGEPKFYCGAVKVKLIGTGDVIITGNAIKQNTVKFILDYSREGSDLEVYNQLINNEVWAFQYASYLYNYYARRTDYTVENRGYVNIDLGDKVMMENNYEKLIPVTILENNVEYDGAIRGQCKFLSNRKETGGVRKRKH